MLTDFKTYNNQGVELYVLQQTYKSMEQNRGSKNSATHTVFCQRCKSTLTEEIVFSIHGKYMENFYKLQLLPQTT